MSFPAILSSNNVELLNNERLWSLNHRKSLSGELSAWTLELGSTKPAPRRATDSNKKRNNFTFSVVKALFIY